MIKTKFSLFQMKIKQRFWNSIKFSQSTLEKALERLILITMTGRFSEFALVMPDTIMLVVPNIHQTIVTAPSIVVDYAFEIYITSNNALKRLFTSIRNDLRIDSALAFKDTKHNRFTRSIPTSFAGDPSGSKIDKIEFIHFDGTSHRSLLLQPLDYLTSQSPKYSRYRSPI